MDPTAEALARLRRFALPMNPDLPAADAALGEVRRLMQDAGVAFKIVGGVAVIHHGYARTTEDVDVLVPADALALLDPELAAHAFESAGPARLRHLPTGLRVDLLIGGSTLPRAGAGVYPSPAEVGASPRDPQVIDLGGLLELKLRARRHRDLADVVELLKRVDEARYIELEAHMDRSLVAELAGLRHDALEEQRWE